MARQRPKTLTASPTYPLYDIDSFNYRYAEIEDGVLEWKEVLQTQQVAMVDGWAILAFWRGARFCGGATQFEAQAHHPASQDIFILCSMFTGQLVSVYGSLHSGSLGDCGTRNAFTNNWYLFSTYAPQLLLQKASFDVDMI